MAASEEGCVAFLCHAQGCSLSTGGKVIIEVIQFLTGLIVANLGNEYSVSLFFTLCPGSSLAQFVAHFCFQKDNRFWGNCHLYICVTISSLHLARCLLASISVCIEMLINIIILFFSNIFGALSAWH